MQNEIHIKQSNPLTIIWNIISTVGTILGLVSFVDDFVTWKNIIEELLDGYRKIAHFPFNLLDISINDYVIDYLFIGSLCGGSFCKALTYGMNNGFLTRGKYPKGLKVFYFTLYLFFWPLGIWITIRQVLFKDNNIKERHIKLRFVRWLLAVLLGFAVILIVNIMFPDKL